MFHNRKAADRSRRLKRVTTTIRSSPFPTVLLSLLPLLLLLLLLSLYFFFDFHSRFNSFFLLVFLLFFLYSFLSFFWSLWFLFFLFIRSTFFHPSIPFFILSCQTFFPDCLFPFLFFHFPLSVIFAFYFSTLFVILVVYLT